MVSNLEGKVVVITGASRGMGAEGAIRLAALGAKVVVAARNLDKLLEVTKAAGLPKEAAVKTDVTKFEDCENLMARTIELYGRIDVLVNGAGVMALGPIAGPYAKQWSAMIDVNVKGVLFCTNAALQYMEKQKSGQVVNLSSAAADYFFPGSTVYTATKAAVNALTEGLRQEGKAANIRSLAICPGAVRTDIVDTIPDPEMRSKQGPVMDIALSPSTFVGILEFAISQPDGVDINMIKVRSTAQTY